MSLSRFILLHKHNSDIFGVKDSGTEAKTVPGGEVGEWVTAT